MSKRDRYKELSELGSSIFELFKAFGYEDEYYRGKVRAEWNSIVGQKIASNVEISCFEGGVLTLKTNNSVWKNEIFFRRTEIMNLINQRYNKKLVSNINIK
jgi:predicted nucleic acid-binding Zn ribbon protein